ncbi:F0F1 ATP synthase subunit A [Halotia wernerae UHCC 0503]|nr:F0F1 ATP synthase subunit A [Halotia wernerae UHCC 0503]
MEITPDNIIFWQSQWVTLNATIVYTWLVMAILVIGSWLVTRNLSVEPENMSPWQNRLEIIVEEINNQIREASQQNPTQFLPLIGTLFLFIALANLLTVAPIYESPAASLSTTAALALCVFVAVPFYGIKNIGLVDYLRNYLRPTPLMLPFNIISELSRTLALAIRLFGNIMSTSLLVAILVTLVPLFFPIVMRAFGVLIGIIQAYVFAILALVYIASGMRRQQISERRSPTE